MKFYKISLFVSFISLFFLGFVESNALIKKSILTWKADYIVKNVDFKAFPNYLQIFIKSYDAGVDSYIDYKILGDNHESVNIQAYMNRHNSWINEKINNDITLLMHEQYHFNITELVARNFRKEVSEISIYKYDKQAVKLLFRSNIEYLYEIQHLYDKQTNHSVIRNEQKKWEKIIDSLIFLFDDYRDTIVTINKKTKLQNSISLMPKLYGLLYQIDNSNEDFYLSEYNENNSYINDNRLQTLYYENGQKMSEVKYLDNRLDGKYLSWYETGELKCEIDYENGERQGLTIEYYKNGGKKNESKYHNGSLLTIKYWNPDGTRKYD